MPSVGVQDALQKREALGEGLINASSLLAPHFPSSGSGDFCRYAATPITELISAAAAPMRKVAPVPVCRLKCCGSMPTAANPVRTPPAAPLIAAAKIPRSQISIRVMFRLDYRFSRMYHAEGAPRGAPVRLERGPLWY